MTTIDGWGPAERVDGSIATGPRRDEPGIAGGAPAEADLAEPAPEETELFYGDVGEFVAGFLAPVWRHRVDPDGRTSTWCRQWWRHPEAVARLDALWRAWEYLRLDPATGMSEWFRDHADYHMAVLTGVDGPFGGCTPAQHKPKFQPLPIDPPEPANLFGVDGR